MMAVYQLDHMYGTKEKREKIVFFFAAEGKGKRREEEAYMTGQTHVPCLAHVCVKGFSQIGKEGRCPGGLATSGCY